MVLLSDGREKMARDITEQDDIDDVWIRTHSDPLENTKYN
jgi:hypothetical protein